MAAALPSGKEEQKAFVESAWAGAEVVRPLDNGRVVVVGSSRGIGLEFTRQLLAKGCEVVATHRGSAPPSELAALADVEQRLTTMSLDVSDPVSVSAASEQLRSSGSYIDAVIHNAGVYGPTVSLDGVARNGRAGARPVTREDLLSVFETNAVGPLLVAQALAPLLEAQRESEPGKALPVYAFLTSKVGSVEDNGSGGAYAYRASKSALNIVAKSFSVDMADATRVVLLHPGFVRTDMTDGKGLIDAEESVSGMIKAIESTGPDFRWVDFKAEVVPF